MRQTGEYQISASRDAVWQALNDPDLLGQCITGCQHVKKIDDENTQLNLELLIVPKLPVPGSVVTGEVAYAADTAVMGSRNRTEARVKAKKKE